MRPSIWVRLCTGCCRAPTISAASVELGTRRYGRAAPRCCNLVMANAASGWPSCGWSIRGGGGELSNATDLHCYATSRWAFSIPARWYSARGWLIYWEARAIFMSCAPLKLDALSTPSKSAAAGERRRRRSMCGRRQCHRAAGLRDRLRLSRETGRDRSVGLDVLHFIRRDRVGRFFRRTLAVEADLRVGIAALLHRGVVDLLGDTGLPRAGDEGLLFLIGCQARRRRRHLHAPINHGARSNDDDGDREAADHETLAHHDTSSSFNNRYDGKLNGVDGPIHRR